MHIEYPFLSAVENPSGFGSILVTSSPDASEYTWMILQLTVKTWMGFRWAVMAKDDDWNLQLSFSYCKISWKSLKYVKFMALNNYCY